MRIPPKKGMGATRFDAVTRNRLMSTKATSTATASGLTAPTQFLDANGETYAYRRFGRGVGRPLLFLQHFTGTLDNWDYAVTDPLAMDREVVLFDNAGVGRSSQSANDCRGDG